MNNFELKKKLKKTYPDLTKGTYTDIMASTEFINTDVQTLIDRSVVSIKDQFTVRTIDEYAEDITIYTQNFLDKLDKLGVHWLISHQPTGLNFYSDENNYVFSEPIMIKPAQAWWFVNQIRARKNDTVMIHRIAKLNSKYNIFGTIVRKSIFAKLLQE